MDGRHYSPFHEGHDNRHPGFFENKLIVSNGYSFILENCRAFGPLCRQIWPAIRRNPAPPLSKYGYEKRSKENIDLLSSACYKIHL